MTTPAVDRVRWPLPDQVGQYGDQAAFDAARKEAGQWVFWQDRADLVLAGRYDDVRPLHIELSPTYLCNFACPWCSCRSAREEWSDADVFNHPRATPLTIMRDTKIDRVLDHLAEDSIDIMWVGGEPTMNPLLYTAAPRASALGLKQCIFTNGSLLTPKRIATLFDANFVFVRVSLNAVSPDVHQQYHDYEERRNYSAHVLANLQQLAEIRSQRRSETLVGVSVVVDEGNLADLANTAAYLCTLTESQGSAGIDYAIFRPAFPFYSAQLDILPDTVEKFLAIVGNGSEWHRRMQEAGISVIVPADSVADSSTEPAADDGFGCLAAGWFGEITPNGDMVACSDRYGNPDYFIGNAATHSVADLWSGPQRRQVLELAKTDNCYGSYCPRNGRGNYFNRTFRQVESFRAQGRIDEVRTWINDLRVVLPRPSHSFFL